MKQLFLLVSTALAISTSALAQHNLHCGSDAVMQKRFDADPTLKARMDAKNNAQRSANYGSRKQQVGPYTIPVVFHILHLGGNENISDAQVLDQMNILNIDYGKRNADTTAIIPSFKTIADSTNIRFALATKDPQGNCTNGIIHYYSADSKWDDASPTLYSQGWDPTKYMNIYVVKTIKLSNGFSAAGYTYLPGSWNTGNPTDAIVVLHDYVGSIGTSSAFNSRVLTHEVGHWLDLLHTFGWNECGVDCNNDDFVNDTPTSKGFLTCPNAANPASYQICTPGVDENFQNFMDYSYCEHMFTHDQGVRMQDALLSSTSGRNNLWTSANLLATGVTNATACAPNANFKTNKTLICVNLPVTYTDASTNAVPTSYAWTFQGGTPATSTNATEQVTYATAGTYNVTLTVTNSVGANTITKTSVIHVFDAVAATPVANFYEGFENSTTFAQNWAVINTDNDNKYFQTTTASSFTGNKCLLLNNNSGTSVATDEIVFPPLDFTGVTSATLKFRYAYTPIDNTNNDKLDLYMQSNCSLGFVGTPRYTRTANTVNPANDLSPIAGNFTFNNYVPIAASTSEWKLVTVNNLAAAYGNNNVVLKYIFTPGGGNNLYIDDIEIITNLSTPIGLTSASLYKNNFSVNPNPSQELSVINFSLTQASHVSLAITNVLGQTEQTICNTNLTQGDHNYDINTSKLAKGMYLIVLSTNGNKTIKKLIVE
ncbi:MAG: M43 family zinc metalloprotease [Bacteroidia bacterium]